MSKFLDRFVKTLNFMYFSKFRHLFKATSATPVVVVMMMMISYLYLMKGWATAKYLKVVPLIRFSYSFKLPTIISSGRHFQMKFHKNYVNKCQRMHVPIVFIFWQQNWIFGRNCAPYQTASVTIFSLGVNWQLEYQFPLTKYATWISWCPSSEVSLES